MAYKTTWSEVESQADADRYCDAIRRAGGNPVKVQLDPAEEEAIILIDSDDSDRVLDNLADDPDGGFCYQVETRREALAYRTEQTILADRP